MGTRMSSVEASDTGIWFVYRSLYEGLAGKRVRRLPDATVLGWFQRMWASTAAVVDIDDEWEAHQWVAERIAAEPGGEVCGLDSVFVEAHDHGIPPPATWQELGAVLTEHLYVEHEVRVDEHSMRASTDDDTIYLAYYCFDDTLAYARPDRAAWLLHQTWELPSDIGPGEPFQPVVPVRPLLPAGDGEGATYVVLPVDDDVLWYERRRPWVLPGVRLPKLAGWLRLVAPAVTEIRGQAFNPLTGTGDLHPHRFEGWPEPLLLLRALVAPGEERLAPALERWNYWPEYFSLVDDYARAELGWALEEHGVAHARALERLHRGGPLWWQDGGRDPSASRIRETEHLIQMAMHTTEYLGYRWWVLFDDLWADAHPDLARGMLRAASSWDPFAP
jgi:hypothetical protein